MSCEYCDRAKAEEGPIALVRDGFTGAALVSVKVDYMNIPDYEQWGISTAWATDPFGDGTSCSVPINYCPMCGRDLREDG